MYGRWEEKEKAKVGEQNDRVAMLVGFSNVIIDPSERAS
jgi:hypothetical protein